MQNSMKKNLSPLTLCLIISAVTLTGCPIKFDTGTIRTTKDDSNDNDNGDDEQAIDIDGIEQELQKFRDDVEIANKPTEISKKAPETIVPETVNAELKDEKAIHKAITASEEDKKLSGNESLEWIMVHNRLRQLHDTAGLTWSDEIAKRAKAYAESCPNGHSASAGSAYGENIAFATGKIMSPTEVTNAWYDEISMYDYTNPSFQKSTGHFTQVVWQETTKLGCGYKTDCKTGEWAEVWVCQYEKVGNNTAEGQFAKNVRPQLTKRTINTTSGLKVQNLGLSKHAQKTKQTEIVNHHEQPNIDMNTKMIHSAENELVKSDKQPDKQLNKKSDKDWDFQQDTNNQNPPSNSLKGPHVPTVEIIDGEQVIQGEGFKISKKVE